MQTIVIPPKTEQSVSLFLLMIFIIMTTSSFVIIEPAPFDLGVIFLLIIGILLHKLKFSTSNIAPALIFLYLFILGSIISMFEMADFNAGIRDFVITFYLILSWYFFLGVIESYSHNAIKALMNGYTIAAIISSTFGILAFFNLIPLQDVLVKFDRVKGFFKDFNVFGPFLIPVALYAYSFIELPKKKNKILWLVIFLILALGIFLSFSRAAFGNFLLSFLLFFGIHFLLNPSMKRIALFLVTLLFLFSTLIFAVSLPSVSMMFTERFEYQYYDDDRFANQGAALEVALNNPLGIGPGQYEARTGFATHNSFLRVLSENGIIGFLGFVGFITVTLSRCIKLIYLTKDPILIVIFASTLGLLLNSLVVDTIHWRHLWLVLAIPWAYNYKEIRRLKSR